MEIVVGPQFSGPTSTTSAKRLKDAGTSSRTPSWWQISIADASPRKQSSSAAPRGP
jgi:hypothetical protein